MGALCPVLDVSPALWKVFNTKYSDLSLCWLLGAWGGSGSASCPANQGCLELEEMGRLLYMYGNDGLLGNESLFLSALVVG